MKDRGFTLLEIMIALAIMGGLLVTLIATLNYHLAIAERHEIRTVAMMLAKEKLYEATQKPEEAKGQFPTPYGQYLFSTEVKGSPFPGISEITVVVEHEKERVELTSLVKGR